jgi:uncharacterized OsmC-like protein
MSEIVSHYSIAVDQVESYRFRARFDKPQYGELAMDEPPPLGQDTAPSAGRILAAAIGDCLSASFLFAAKKNGFDVSGLRAEVTVEVVRNERRRFRIGGIKVKLDPQVAPADAEKARAAAAVFEDFCTITASVREGIPVEVTVAGI